ncbi:MAG: hypothetical protein HGA75_16585 [Thiobacillus sp.]|nr:hypothetical protein [Thiobacillus sp.]
MSIQRIGSLYELVKYAAMIFVTFEIVPMYALLLSDLFEPVSSALALAHGAV